MDKVLVLENRDDAFEELSEIVLAVDENIKLERFKSKEEFLLWSQSIITSLKGIHPNLMGVTEFLPPGFSDKENKFYHPYDDKDQFGLLIVNSDLINSDNMNLFERISKAIKLKGHLNGRFNSTESLQVCFVNHEGDENFDLKKYHHDLVNNILFRPFDQVVTIGKIHWALYGMKSKDKIEIYKESPKDFIEMRKEIPAKNLTLLGFESVSEKALQMGDVACYYGFPFLPNKETEGIYGVVRQRDQANEQKKLFSNYIEFLTLDVRVIRSIKDGLLHSPSEKKTIVPIQSMAQAINLNPRIAFIHEKDHVANLYKEQLKDLYPNAEVNSFSHIDEFMLELNPGDVIDGLSSVMENNQSLKDEIGMVFDQAGQIFLRYEPGPPKKEFYGLSFENGHNLKKMFMDSLSTEVEKKNFTVFWLKGSITDYFIIKSKMNGKDLFLHLGSRQKYPIGPGRSGLKFILRPASLDEIKKFYSEIFKKPAPYNVVFISSLQADKKDDEYFIQIREIMSKISMGCESFIFRVSQFPVHDNSQIEILKRFDGYLTEVTDREYLSYLLASKLTNFLNKTNSILVKYTGDFTLEAGVNIGLKSISEVHLSFSYPKSILPNTIRTFTIMDPETRIKKRLSAKCVYSEKDRDNSDNYIQYFVFFGISEHDNLVIRRWMLSQYFMKKAGSE